MSAHDSPAAWRRQRLWPQGDPAPRRGDPGAGPVDDSLTNLQWLQEFSIRTSDPEKPPASGPLGHRRALRDSDAPASSRAVDAAAAGMRLCPGTPGSGSSGPVQLLPPTPDTVDYRTNAQVKPPHSYVTLIRMAMQASRGAKVPLSAIYTWIMDNFCYYRQADPSWQNSIRHNLSLNKCFRKVPRQKDEPGKGGFWQVDPQYADLLASGACRRGRLPKLPSLAPGTREPACSHGPGQGPGQGPLPPRGPESQWPDLHHRLGTCKQPSALGTGAVAWTAPAPPLVPTSQKPELSWASAPEDSLASGSGSFEDLELTAALGALATGEGALGAHSEPLGALGKEGAVVADRALCAVPWEGESVGPTAVPAWAFEGGPCLAEGFLAEMQPWEG